MSVKVLAINFSQTGQLDEIIETFLRPFDKGMIDRVKLRPAKEYPFPWPTGEFFDEMPETVLEEGVELSPFHLGSERYDLIILGYQPWFLSPPPVISSLLRNEEFLKRLNGTPVITMSGCRNMWINAQESIKAGIKKGGGKLVGNLPLVDRAQNYVSLVTILYWLLNGKKDRKWGLFPAPGVSREDIESAEKYGNIANEALSSNDFTGLQQKFVGLGGIKIPTDVLFIEERAKRLFLIWANLIKKNGTTPAKRRFLVSAFKYYLLTALCVISPILLAIYYPLIRPFTGRQLRKKKEYFCGVESKN